MLWIVAGYFYWLLQAYILCCHYSLRNFKQLATNPSSFWEHLARSPTRYKFSYLAAPWPLTRRSPLNKCALFMSLCVKVRYFSSILIISTNAWSALFTKILLGECCMQRSTIVLHNFYYFFLSLLFSTIFGTYLFPQFFT